MSRPSTRYIRAIVRLQSCSTIPGRHAFLARDRVRHGVAGGFIRFYVVTAKTWTMIRALVADYGLDQRGTIGYTTVNRNTVEYYDTIANAQTGMRALPLGTTCLDAKRYL